MKVSITSKKAPWPTGATVGDIVQFAGDAPPWAVGKFKPADDDAKADYVYESDAPLSLAEQIKALRENLDAANSALEEALAEIERLRAQLEASQSEEGKASAALAEANAQATREKAGKTAKG